MIKIMKILKEFIVNNNGVSFISIFLVIIGFNLLISGEFSVKGNIVDLSENNINIYLGTIFILFSFIIIYIFGKKKNNE